MQRRCVIKRYLQLGAALAIFAFSSFMFVESKAEVAWVEEPDARLLFEITSFSRTIASVHFDITIKTPPEELVFTVAMLVPETLTSRNPVFIMEPIPRDPFYEGPDERFLLDRYLWLDWNGRDFPDDAYRIAFFVGTSKVGPFPEKRLATLGLPTSNYLGFWDFHATTEEHVEEFIFATTGRDIEIRDIPNWILINATIGHPPGFTERAMFPAVHVPMILKLLVIPMAAVPGIVLIDMARLRKRVSPRIKLIERFCIPICSAVVLFLPFYPSLIEPIAAPVYSGRFVSTSGWLAWSYVVVLLVNIAALLISRRR